MELLTGVDRLGDGLKSKTNLKAYQCKEQMSQKHRNMGSKGCEAGVRAISIKGLPA